jgi:predicted dienelactone hydrolase
MANPIDRIRPDAPALSPYGPYPVGVRTLTMAHADQIDVLNVTANVIPRYDRPLKVEVWYPATATATLGGTYRAMLRDGMTEVTLTGRAVRDAAPTEMETKFPLVLISHGYPGNRYLMAHLGENLASKGYVTAAIDHTDSTYADQAAFGSTLLNRPLDQAFVLDQLAALPGPLGAIIDTDRVGLIGYSMGGYGALIFGGAGLTEAAPDFSWGPPRGLLSTHVAGSQSHEDLIDPRLSALVVIGPWGRNAGLWDANSMAGLRVPTLFMAGGSDDVSIYETIRVLFQEATGVDRHLLTFEHANHNAAAPIPAPEEAWTPVDTLDFVPFEHYADAVWDTVRMNNIAQHFTTAFMDLHLKNDESRAPYLALITRSDDGVVALGDDDTPTEDHTYWLGFAPRSAAGLRFETLRAAD